MLISDFNVQKILLDYGYRTKTNKTAQIFSHALDKVFFGFGEIIQNGLITETKKLKLPNDFMFPYFTLVQQSVTEFMGKTSGEKILEEINKEITTQTNLTGSTIEILNEISRREIFENLNKLSGHEHILYLWKDEKIRDKIFNQFFNGSKGIKGLISSKKITDPSIRNFEYSEIFENKTEAINKNREILSEIHEKNNPSKPTRIAGEDGTVWFDRGLKKEILELEKEADQYITENSISGICAYDIKKITNETLLNDILKSHPFVLLDDPFVIYERGN
jgi:hypothetical protein